MVVTENNFFSKKFLQLRTRLIMKCSTNIMIVVNYITLNLLLIYLLILT